MAIKLEVKNLYKVFGEHPERAFKLLESGKNKEQIFAKTGLSVGVKDANLAIEEGEIFVIMGLSGSGKSTLVRLLLPKYLTVPCAPYAVIRSVWYFNPLH